MPDLATRYDVIGALLEVAPDILDREFKPDVCILATRISIEALRAFGIEATPQPVNLLCFNPEARQLMEEGVPQEELVALMAPIDPGAPGGPWTIGVHVDREGPDPLRYNGHLATLVDDVLLDLTLPQLNRPHKHIVVTPMAVALSETWEQEGRAGYLFPNGTLVVWERSDDPKWRAAPDWTWPTANGRRQLMRSLVGEIIRGMRKELA